MLFSRKSFCLEDPRIVVISPSMSHPRYHRRVFSLLSAGFRVTVYSFERGYYKCNTFPAGCELINLGPVRDGHYFERSLRILGGVRKIWFMEHKRQPAILVYGFELDSAILGSIAVSSSRGIVYEVGDLRRPASGRLIFSRAVGLVEDILIRRSSLLVNTSPAFIEHFFDKRSPSLKQKCLVIENKLSKSVVKNAPRPVPKPVRYPLKLGYVGLLRYEKTFVPLLKIISKYKDRYSLHIYGDGPLRSIVEQNAVEHSNIFYYDFFRNPEDLARIYNSIDLCYVVYDNADLNVKLALPNKLYESVYFCVPMIVATETALYNRVKKWDVGWGIDPNKQNFLDEFFSAISLDDIDQKKRNAGAVDQKYLIENWTELHIRLRSFVDKNRNKVAPVSECTS